ncbi:MAG: RluA family pseudouridine synthase [Chlamydiota bacterium]
MKFTADRDGPLLDLLQEQHPQSSKTTLRSWVKEGRILVDQRPAKKANQEIVSGQQIELGTKKKFLPQGIEVLYDDAHITVIHKPERLLSVSTDFDQENTAHAILKDYYYPKKVFVVHRLDQDTSGVMLFALKEEACEELKKMFEAHSLKRSYTAIVEGHFKEKQGTWKSYLFEDSNYVVHSSQDPKRGKLAITHYQVDGTSKRYSLLDVTLETGKKNQIRVHCSEAGHPIVGDKKYGAETNTIRRLCLHAYALSFEHPVTKKHLTIRSLVPEKFYQLVKPGLKGCTKTKSG